MAEKCSYPAELCSKNRKNQSRARRSPNSNQKYFGYFQILPRWYRTHDLCLSCSKKSQSVFVYNNNCYNGTTPNYYWDNNTTGRYFWKCESNLYLFNHLISNFFHICNNNLNVKYPDSINWLKITYIYITYYFIIKIKLSMADEPSRGQLHAKLVFTLTQKIEDDSAFNNMFKFLQSTINGAE